MSDAVPSPAGEARRTLRERLVIRAMQGMVSADNENYCCLSLTIAEWRELDALLAADPLPAENGKDQ